MMSLRTALGFVSDRFSFDLTAQSPFGEFKIGGNTLLGSSEVNNQITTSVNDKANRFIADVLWFFKIKTVLFNGLSQ